MKKNLFFILGLLLLIAPLRVHASNDVAITCNKTRINAGAETTCQVSVNKLNFIPTDVTGKVSVSNNLSITSSSYSSAVWLSLDSKFSVTDINLIRQSNSKVDKIVIATFKIKAKSNATGSGTITFSDVAMGDSNYNSVSLNSSSLKVSFTSGVNTLKSLSVSGANIEFSSSKTSYSVETTSSTIEVKATPTDSKAKITGTGIKKLNYGANTLKVVVTAENGTTKTYTINVNRKDTRSSNNYLKSLSLSNGSIAFNKNTTNYDVIVANEIKEIIINATLEDSKASFVKGYGPRTETLNYGANKIQVKVKSEQGTEKIYTINVTRKDGRSSNNNLKNITISEGTLVFNKDITEYKTTVPYDTKNISVTGTLEDTKAKLEVIGDNTLKVGKNTFILKVTAENGSIKEYKIIVTRLEKEKIITSDKISVLEIEGHEINFYPDNMNYNLTTNDKKLNIKVTTQDPKATYEIEGNENLKNGSIVTITVTDQNKSRRIYQINIKNSLETSCSNNSEDDENNKILIILLVISIAANVFLVIKLKKDQKEEKNIL